MVHHGVQEKEQLIGAIMRHMLFRQKQKPDQPVRRDELAKLFQASTLLPFMSPAASALRSQ